MKLDKLKKTYLNNQIPKAHYIEKMFRIHKYLYDYSQFIKDTDIEKIEISDNSVVMMTREKIKIICDKNDRRIVPMEILNFGSYEKEETRMFLSLLDNGSYVFDIGANFGWYSLLFSKYFKNAKIFAFEPIKRTFNYLKLNIKLNNASNIKPFNLGFSDKNGEGVFYFRTAESASASLADLKEDRRAKRVVCKMARLDDFVRSKKLKVDLIKCDVEGSELLVFKGGREVITKNKPIIFAEMLRKWSAKFNYHPNEIISLLKSIGYECFTAKGGLLKKLAKMTDETVETNFFFLHLIKHGSKIKQLSR